jgi:outer membrane biogenesis lipoprotein LolB
MSMKRISVSLPIAALFLGACAITASGQTGVPTTGNRPAFQRGRAR